MGPYRKILLILSLPETTKIVDEVCFRFRIQYIQALINSLYFNLAEPNRKLYDIA